MDEWIERVNQKIARILGKKPESPKLPNKNQDKISNLGFSIIMLLCIFMLWCSTGFYYVPEGQAGLILRHGRLTQVLTGMQLGFTWPYPLAEVVLIDCMPSNFIDLTAAHADNESSDMLSQDAVPIQVSGKFNYQIVNPDKTFLQLLQQHRDVDNVVTAQVRTAIKQYIASSNQLDLMQSNFTVIAGEIRDTVNIQLAPLGIKIIRLNITNLSIAPLSIESPNIESSPAVIESSNVVLPNNNASASNASNPVQSGGYSRHFGRQVTRDRD